MIEHIISWLVPIAIWSLLAWCAFRFGHNIGYDNGYNTAEQVANGPMEVDGDRLYINGDLMGDINTVIIARNDEIKIFRVSGRI